MKNCKKLLQITQCQEFVNLGEMDKFLEYNLPKLNGEEAESLNKLIIAGDIEAVIQKLCSH